MSHNMPKQLQKIPLDIFTEYLQLLLLEIVDIFKLSRLVGVKKLNLVISAKGCTWMALTLLKEAPKLRLRIIFLSTTKRGRNTTSILNCHFFKINLCFRTAHQLSIFKIKKNYILQTVFTWSALLWRAKKSSHRPRNTKSVSHWLKKKWLTNLQK